MSKLVFIDTETTGLDADRHEIWEVAAISDDGEGHWFLPVNLARADSAGLRISRYHDRHPNGLIPDGETHIYKGRVTPLHVFARQFMELTREAHLVGAVVSFDEERLRKLLRAHGECPMWHYHIIDIEALAVGYIAGRDFNKKLAGPLVREDDLGAEDVDLPWKSDEISLLCGVTPPTEEERHTALGDARWVKRWYEQIMGSHDSAIAT